MGRKTEDLHDKEFEGWVVLRRDDAKKDNAYWICRCRRCGLEKSVNGSHLRRGKSLSCRKCSESKHKGRLNSRIWHRMLWHAKKRQIPVDLGDAKEARRYLYDLLYKTQRCRCALTGLPIGLSNTIAGDQHGETTASIDRVDSSKGYTKDNVQWVHKWVNAMKWDLSQDEFITLCEAVVRHKRK